MKPVPAFPIPGVATGLTMRDWFAGMALQGMWACNGEVVGNEDTDIHQAYAIMAYAQADAMMAQRALTEE